MDFDLNEEPSEHEETSQQMVVAKSSMPFLKPPKSKISKRSSRPFLKPPKSKISKRSSKSPFRPHSTKKAHSNIKRDQKKHKILFEKGGLPEGIDLFYKSKGKILQRGTTKDRGIHCNCCQSVITPSKFEIHSGMGALRKPYEHIFLSNGVSLRQFASSLKKDHAKQANKNVIECIGCRKDEDLSICVGLPKPLYNECIPLKKRFCEHCKSSMKSLEPKANALVQKSTINPRIRTADSPNKDKLVACALCRSYDFSESGFNDQTVIVCDQCEREYHIGCLKEHMNIHLTELPSGNWFCTASCDSLYSDLKILLTRGPEKVPVSLIGSSFTDNIADHDVKWIIICGKDNSQEDKLLLKEAVDIYHDCFNPIIDSVTGKDFIHSMAYGLKMGDSDFSGVYSAMLTIDSKVVTAGMFRILGTEIAEFPIVATSKPYQGKGYFQLFFTCFEKLLSYYKIKKIMLPAAKNAQAMWTKKFSFKKVPQGQLRDYRETYTSMVYFLGTTLLEKNVPKGQTTAKRGGSFSLKMADQI